MFEEEIKKAKNQCANQDFDLLLKYGNIAFYKACEVTQCFLLKKTDKKILNYFTLFCFDEFERVDKNSTYLLTKLEKIDENYSLGISQKRISIEAAKQAFFNIQKGMLNFDGECVISKRLVLIPKAYCPSLYSKSTIFLNLILKPNYWGGNYLIEYFDEAKDFFENDDKARQKFDKINKIVKSVKEIKIDLNKVYDRIGNIIFQFPVTLLSAKIFSEKDSVNMKIKSFLHPNVKNIRNFHIESVAKFDNVISGFCEKDINGTAFTEILRVGDDNNLNTLIADKNSGLILYNTEVNFIKSLHISGRLGIQYSEPRTIVLKNGEIKNVEMFIKNDFGENESQSDYFARIQKRNRYDEIISKSGDYKLFKGNQRNEALDYLRNKIRNCSGIKEICLWDPYLVASDILDTLYFENTGICFRCITSYQKAKEVFQKNCACSESKEETMSFKKFCNQQSEYFETHSNNLRVKLKFLAQHGGYGWKFHDRFLIFVPNNSSDLPAVYSLGTSVNILGENHHIIQKVTNPREIFENFEELWALLDNGKCVVKEIG